LVNDVYNYYGLNSYLKNTPMETVEIHSNEAYGSREEMEWNPNNETEGNTYRSNFREDIPDAGTRNRDQDPDRNRYTF
jgi:hypothetical protein